MRYLTHNSLLLIIMLLASFSSFAEDEAGNCSISGTVLTSDNQPVAGVNVRLKSLNRTAVSNERGQFMITKLIPGHYTVMVSSDGYKTVEQAVDLAEGQQAEVILYIGISASQLDEVAVVAAQNKLKKESEYVARMPLKNIENPQVYNVVTKELMRDQVVVSFDDAVKNAPGVNRLWSSTGRAGDGAGYFSMRGFSVQPTMINGVAGLTNGGIDPANIERIETIKGPSGTLFGSSLVSFGGLMNIVTKRPFAGTGGEISYTTGSYGLNRITADVNTQLNKEGTALLRVNGAYHYEGSYQDAGFKRSFFLAPSFAYQASERLSFLVNTEFYHGESTNPLMVFLNRSRQLIARTPDELGIDFNRSFTSNDLTIKTPTVNLFGQATYKISSAWTSQTNVARSIRNTDGYYSYVMFLDQGAAPGTPNDTLFSRYISNQTGMATTTNVQQNFIGDFKIAGKRNRVVAGIDYIHIQTNNNNTPYIADYVSAIRKNDTRYGLFNQQIVDDRLGQSTAANTRTVASTSTYGAYVSNVLNVTDNLVVMASVRVDRFDNMGTLNHNTGVTTGKYEQTTISPKFGVVYELLKDRVSVFGNYMNGFRNVAPATQPLPELNSTFKPQNANQMEGGVKLDVFDHKLSLTASYYDILVTNMTRPSTFTKDTMTYTYTVQDGSQRSKGFEFDLAASPVRGMQIIAGYGYNNSVMEKADKNVEGRRPVSAGPEHLANFWLSYTLPSTCMKGLGAGFGGNYASENVITNDLRTGTFTLPSYTVFNAAIFYNTKAWRLALKLDNISNLTYYGGWTTVERQMPRRLSANVAFKF